jgi:hypothetical protein
LELISANKPNIFLVTPAGAPPILPVYLALIADLAASRLNPDRAGVQAALRALLADLNRDLGPAVLAAPFVLTAGDEVQALFRDVPREPPRPPGQRPVDALWKLTDELATLEQPIVFGLGCGALSTGPLPPPPAQAESAALLDGPCFHRARAALERAQKSRGWVACSGFTPDFDLMLDGLFEVMGVIRGGWTAKQRAYALDMRRLDLQKDLAELHHVSPSVVSESLKAASFEAILHGEEAAHLLLARAAESARNELEGA